MFKKCFVSIKENRHIILAKQLITNIGFKKDMAVGFVGMESSITKVMIIT